MTLKYTTPPETVYMNTLLVGPPKVGKTAGAASAPGPNVYLNGDLPNALHYAYMRYGERIKPVEWDGFQTLKDLMLLAQSPDPPMCITIDPVSDIYRLLLEDLSHYSVSPSLPTYQAVGVHLERFCRALCKAPVNAIFVCHDVEVKNEATGDVTMLPYTGTNNTALGRKLQGMVDIIGSVGVMNDPEDPEPQYVAQLRHGKGRIGGDRFDVLGPWRPLDLTDWFNTVGVGKPITTNQTTQTKE